MHSPAVTRARSAGQRLNVVHMADVKPTPASVALRALLDAHRPELDALLEKYSAKNPRLFGSVARGEAHEQSDIDILVDMDPAQGNLLMRAAGLLEDTRVLFPQVSVDIFPVQLMKRGILETAQQEAVPI